MKKMKRDSFGGKHGKGNKYRDLKPSEQKHTSGQRRKARYRASLELQ